MLFDLDQQALVGDDGLRVTVETMIKYHIFMWKTKIRHMRFEGFVKMGNDEKEIKKLKEGLFTEFEIKDLGRLKYFLKIEVLRSQHGIFICQKKYILDLLAETGMIDCKPAETPMIVNQKLYIDDEAKTVNKDRYQRMVNQPPAYQALAYQAPIPQTQSVSTTDFESYVKANDAVLRNIQNQGQNLQIQMPNLMDTLSKFVSSNTASSSGSETLPSNTITNPKEDLKGITTRSGVAYQGTIIPTPFKVVKQGTEVTKDQVQTPSSQSTEPVQPLVVQPKTQTSVSEPVVAPVSVPMPNLKPSIPYPSRRDNERRRDQANEQIEKFYKIFKDMSFEISFTDALILMPKFASTLKALIGNKKKLSEMARTSMNEHCSAVILNKLPRKLGDLDKFLIPCEFPGIDECLALADLGASINLMPLSVWEGLSLPKLTPTCMTLELADHSVSKPIGIAKDVSVKVGVFHFPADFVVVEFEPDPRVPLILKRCFLKTGRALIDVHKGELTLHIENEAITYNLDQTARYSANYNQMTSNKINVIDMACEEYSQEVLGFSDVIASGNPTPYDALIVSTTSPTLTLVKNKQENDKIETKPDQIKEKQEAWKSSALSKPITVKKERKMKKIQSLGAKNANPTNLY
nr:reverse transcriptase domain-containing protein [Tanacetum cinerariifolium]